MSILLENIDLTIFENEAITIYYGSDSIVSQPEIRIGKFKYPTHQISFHSARALKCLDFERSYDLNVDKRT